MPRIHVALPLHSGESIALPEGAARHVQVLRLQPGAALTLFDGSGGEFAAEVTQMGRSSVQVLVGEHLAVEREAARQIHLAVGIPANDRMDWLVEKAAELGAASIQPLLTERSVLRLTGERAAKRLAHWQAISAAACEQCGRNRVPAIHPLLGYTEWLENMVTARQPRLLLTPATSALGLASWLASDAGQAQALTVLSGPEGGLSAAEEAAALASGCQPVSLGPRVLRAETAPLAALAALALLA